MVAPLLLYKPKGITPLAALTLLKKHFPEYTDQTLSYAGRLDPMAEGLLLVLRGEQNKNRKQFEEMEKTYEFSLLCGVSTDTYDVLGKVLKSSNSLPSGDIIPATLQKIISTLPSSFLQPYPPYSSKPVLGKPLFWWAREGRLEEIIRPTRRVSVISLTISSSTLLAKKTLETEILENISLVAGDFRQAEIKKEWKQFFATTPLSHFPLFTFTIKCSSGTYIRGLCDLFGEKMGIPSLAYSIKRIAVGPYSITECLQLVQEEHHNSHQKHS